jgi:hypothetical protein
MTSDAALQSVESASSGFFIAEQDCDAACWVLLEALFLAYPASLQLLPACTEAHDCVLPL